MDRSDRTGRVVHNSGGRIRDVGARPRRDETFQEGSELRRLLGREVRKGRGHRFTPAPMRLLEDRATGGAQLHDTPSSVVRVKACFLAFLLTEPNHPAIGLRA